MNNEIIAEWLKNLHVPDEFILQAESGEIRPCKHLGKEVPPKERLKYSLDLRRSWFYCPKGFGKEMEPGTFANCSCLGCNPTCKGYE